ncbi:HD domain-containing protein,GlnD PII-uridylyltransferase,nucleotidyltransferase family protein [alpha proteobacterium HIMB59]|nr:HD domain-containing protein,GlnD PII-uridylyltransferase,nucleotidyltransferase family protein [alpha proteobacterium HIMB59]
MNEALKLKKKYKTERDQLFDNLISSNDGFIFNNHHTKLVDDIVRDIVQGIIKEYSIDGFALIAVGGYGRNDLSPKSDVDLLFLYKKANKNIKNFITSLNNSLWDVGLEVGISFLTLKQAIIDSKKDIKTVTKFAESRHLIGDEDYYGEFVRSIKILIGRMNPLKLSEKKLLELVERHDYHLGIKSNLEPQIKEGIGGLRDIHTIIWVSIFMFNILKLEDLIQINIFTSKEIKELRSAWKFLLTVRAFIHLFNDSKGDSLSIENQLKISKKLSYRNNQKEKGVERFMKHLFVNIAKIESLLNTFYSKLPEELIIKTIHKSKPAKTKSLDKKYFIEKGFVHLKNYNSKNLLQNWLGVFESSLKHNLFVHPRFLKTIEEKRKQIKKSMTTDQYETIVDIISSKKNPIQVLRNLNDTKVLNELFPEFGRVWGQVQFDIYHHYTTDEHLLLTLYHLHELKKKSFYKEIYSRLHQKVALHVALLFHDIGKKGPKSHSIYGKELTQKIFKRLPLSVDDQELSLWLIENHLLMSDIAFKNDPQDPDVIASFTAIANTQEKVNSLFLFTLCDIAAVGPNILNEWRISLLRSLLFNARDFLQRGLDTANYSSSVQESLKKMVLEQADKEMKVFIKKSIRYFPNLYWEAFSSKMILDIFGFYHDYQKNKKELSIKFLNYNNKEYGAVIVICPNRSGVLKDIVAGFNSSQINILGSRIISLNNNDIIDVFWVTSSIQKAIVEKNEQERVIQNITSSLNQEELETYQPLFQTKIKVEVEPRITIDNQMSKLVTTFQILSGDRQGLLMDILQIFHDQNMSVQSAKISTYGEKVFDIFQITDLKNKKIKDTKILKTLEDQLLKILS